RLARAPIPPPLVAPDGSPGSDQDTRAAFLAEVMERRGAERERRHDLFPHAALAMRLAGTAPTRLWSSRPGDDGAFEIAIGLGDIGWRPELSYGTGPTAGPDSVLAELGPLPMVPVTVDLRHERGVGFVGSTEFTRAAVRGLLVEACVRYGPADLDVVVLTDPDRAPMWEWVKWLPHNHASGVAQILVALDQIDSWVASIDRPIDVERQSAPRLDHLTLAVVDEAEWWRERPAPLRSVMNDAWRPVRFIALADSPNDLPTVCTTLVTEQPGDLARVERLGARTVVDDVRLYLLATPVAAATARRLAPFDDPELRVPAASTLPVSVPIPQLLGPANLTAATLAARWRATSPRSYARVPIGVTQLGTVEIDLERDGPHVLIGGAPGTGKSELLRSLVVGLAAGLPPEAITFALLDLEGQSTFGSCARLPHVVMHHDVSRAHLAERSMRCLRAELLGRDEAAWRGAALSRLVVVIDEPSAVVTQYPGLVSSLLEIAVQGERLGVHLILATGRPSLVLDEATAPAIGVRIALRLADERESEALIGTREATRVPRRTPGRGYIRLGGASPFEFQATLASASSSPDNGHDLELRPYVVGRELTPMELRVARASSDDVAVNGSGGGVQNDLSRLASEITAAAVELGQARPRRIGPDPLPDVLDPRDLVTDHPGDGVPFALVDLPDRQRQEIRRWEPGPTGSLLIYGSARAGTSSVLASLAVGAAQRYPADDLHLYVIDAGALKPLDSLPHTGAVVPHDDADRVARLVDVVGREIDRRTATATRGMRDAASPLSGSLTPHVVVMIDDVGALRRQLDEQSRLDDVWAGITRIVREGPAVSVCVVATAEHARDVPTRFAAQIPSRLVMDLADPSDYASFGLRAIDLPRFVPGRALDPADRTELQIVQPAVSLAAAVVAVVAEPARFRPPVAVKGSSS
ncbi:MAG: FtsK/SpoIIIE domain-containing protein, partial [Acidimicrobiia bacterium]